MIRWTDTLTMLGCGRVNIKMHVNRGLVTMQITRRKYIHTRDGIAGEYLEYLDHDVNVETRRFTVLGECIDALAALIDDESTVNELTTQARYELMAVVGP